MYKNNIRTKKKKELFWIPHAKLITSFLFVATVIFLILMYINYRKIIDLIFPVYPLFLFLIFLVIFLIYSLIMAGLFFIFCLYLNLCLLWPKNRLL